MQELIKVNANNDENNDVNSLIESISIIKDKVFEIQSKIKDLDKLSQLESKIISLQSDRDVVIETIASLKSANNIPLEILRSRIELKDLFIEWLDCLNTLNISKDIKFSDDFIPELGNEKITQLSGSTRIRAVLAYHAALIELLLRRNSCRLKLLVLDTPKQHDIDNHDLNSFMLKLKSLSIKYELQIIFSTTGYHYTGDSSDKEWNPTHPGPKQLMYLY